VAGVEICGGIQRYLLNCIGRHSHQLSTERANSKSSSTFVNSQTEPL
jgi:hypothetical protein